MAKALRLLFTLSIVLLLLMGRGFAPSIYAEEPEDEGASDGDEASEGGGISAEEATSIALQHLEELYGPAEYVVEEVTLDEGDYEVQVVGGDRIFVVTVDGETGEVKGVEAEGGGEEGDGEAEDAAEGEGSHGAEEAGQDDNEDAGQAGDDEDVKQPPSSEESEDEDVEESGGEDEDAEEPEDEGAVEEGEDAGEAEAEEPESEEPEDGGAEEPEGEEEPEEEPEDEGVAEEGEVQEERESSGVEISAEEAFRTALEHLEERFGAGNYVLREVELNDGDYKIEIMEGARKFELRVDGETGEVVELEVEEEEEPTPPPAIDTGRAVEIADQLLVQHFGEGEYTVTEIELEDGVYELKVEEGGDEFEFKIDAETGQIIKFEGEKRELKIEIKGENGEGLKMEVKQREDGEGFKVNVERSEAKLQLEFEQRQGVTKSELQLGLLFDRLIEFLDDGSASGVFDEDDTVVASIDLKTLQWTVDRVEETDESGALTMVTITQNGTGSEVEELAFIYHLTPVSRVLSVNGEEMATVRIWEVKFDIRVSGYRWNQGDASLALSAAFSSEFEAEVEDAQEVKFKEVGGVRPFFNWGGNATADGVQIRVGSRIEDAQRLYLSYPPFEETLVHDPRIGYVLPVTLPALEVLTPMLLTVGAGLIAAVLAAALVLKARRFARAVLAPSGL